MSKSYVKKLLALNFGFNIRDIFISMFILNREEIQSVHFVVKTISYMLRKVEREYILFAWDPLKFTWNAISVSTEFKEVKK